MQKRNALRIPLFVNSDKCDLSFILHTKIIQNCTKPIQQDNNEYPHNFIIFLGEISVNAIDKHANPKCQNIKKANQK